ncbi:hypothetical protein BDY19DRAFT_903041 [Irpex rosettiformis]|uniref:Uncharacterized protein n=1 Tax=Irpex rosettiformis TaxID=378272 RepID=A0ACB8UG73_9APHY|nr:hypothetical protein BDY19DRAFT_903041 [Irpex rosettiformis]
MSNEEATIHVSGFGSQFHQGRPPLLVKITGYRIMTTSTLLICGTWKAIATYRGKAILSADLDLVAGMILALLVYWLGIYETSDPPCLKWFFHKDYASVLKQSRSSLTELPLPVVARHRGTSTPSLSDMGDTESSPIPLVPVGTSNYPDGALVNEASSASLPPGGQPSPNVPLARWVLSTFRMACFAPCRWSAMIIGPFLPLYLSTNLYYVALRLPTMASAY